MDAQDSGDLIDAAAYSVDELREAVFEGRGRVARPLALALLSRKDYPRKVADMQKILLDESEQPRLRALAASALGQVPTPASVRALERALGSGENVTQRAATKALAQVGAKKHVDLLDRLAGSPGPVGKDARRAADVLRQRLRLAGPARRGELATVPVQATGKPTPIRVRAAAAGDVAGAIRALPTRKPARRSAVSMTCAGRRLVFVFDETSLRQGVDVVRRGGEVGFVAEPPGIESGEWSARYRVVVEPAAKEAFRVVVTTLDGRAVFAGTGRVGGREATFELGAVDRPGATPIEIRGRFDGRKLTFDQARSGVRRRPSRHPTGESPPDRRS